MENNWHQRGHGRVFVKRQFCFIFVLAVGFACILHFNILSQDFVSKTDLSREIRRKDGQRTDTTIHIFPHHSNAEALGACTRHAVLAKNIYFVVAIK